MIRDRSHLSHEDRLAIARVAKIEAEERTARNKVNKAERRARSKRIGSTFEGQRKERQRDNAYLAATRRCPCVVGLAHGGCEGRIDPEHLRFTDRRYNRFNPGKGAKPDDKWCAPLCRKHHEEQHNRGDEEAFWVEYGFTDVGAMDAERYAAFKARLPGEPILVAYAAEANSNLTKGMDGTVRPRAREGDRHG